MQDELTAWTEDQEQDSVVSSLFAAAMRYLEHRAENEVVGYLLGEAPAEPAGALASWLEFNERYLLQAQRAEHPLLERIKWLSVYCSRLDGYIQTGVPKRRLRTDADGWTPARFALLQRSINERLERAATLWSTVLVPALRDAGVSIRDYATLTAEQRKQCSRYFREVVAPQCTPAVIDAAHPLPWLASGSTAVGLLLHDADARQAGAERLALVTLPEALPRLVAVADGSEASGTEDGVTQLFIWLEELVTAHLDELFPGDLVSEAASFRVLRQEWLGKAEEDDDDEEGDDTASLLEDAEQRHQRRLAAPVAAMQAQASMPSALRSLLVEQLGNPADSVYTTDAPVGLAESRLLFDLRRPELRFPAFKPRKRLRAAEGKIFKQLRAGDLLLHHPYDSPQQVVDFVEQAARDGRVTEISQTLYKVDAASPMVRALLQAAAEGRAVTVVAELRSRGNEAEMVNVVRTLEEGGVTVVHGLPSFRTHCKVTLITREEKRGSRRYAHLGTGNYQNSKRVDFSLITADPAITADLATLFECVMGHADAGLFRQLLVSPWHLRRTIIAFINRETTQAQRSGEGRIILKVNGLTDDGIIEALWRAARAGVNVDIVVRSRSGMQPPPDELNGRIRVVVPVGRFPEHGRLFYFHNGGQEELYMGSSDLQARNLDQRIELLTPICDPTERRRLVDTVLEAYFRDTLSSMELGADLRLRPLDAAQSEQPSETAIPRSASAFRRVG